MSREAEAAYSREENGENQRTAKIQSCFTMHSTITIHSFSFWQGIGIVEIIARGILLAILLIVIGTCTVVIDQANQFQDRLAVGVEYKSFQTVAVWALVTANVAFIYESIFTISTRLLNFQWMSKDHIPAVTVDNIFNVVLAIWLLAVAICLGNYGAFIKSKRDDFSTSDYFADSNVNPVIQDLNDKHSNTVISAAFFTFLSSTAFHFLNLLHCIRFCHKYGTLSTIQVGSEGQF